MTDVIEPCPLQAGAVVWHLCQRWSVLDTMWVHSRGWFLMLQRRDTRDTKLALAVECLVIPGMA